MFKRITVGNRMIYRLHDALPPDDNDEGGDETSQCHESAEDAKSDDATCE